MSDNKQDESEFRVVDKRRFAGGPSGSGNASPTQSDSEPKQAETQAKAEPKVAEDVKQEAQAKQSSDREQLPEVEFSSFILSYATQALMMLGEIPHPETGERMYNPAAARHSIDVIGMIEEKTKGNLSTEEGKLIEEILASLRLTFVERTKK